MRNRFEFWANMAMTALVLVLAAMLLHAYHSALNGRLIAAVYGPLSLGVNAHQKVTH